MILHFAFVELTKNIVEWLTIAFTMSSWFRQHDDNRIIYCAYVEWCITSICILYYCIVLLLSKTWSIQFIQLILALEASKWFFSHFCFVFHFFFWILMSCNMNHVNLNPFDGIIRSEFHAKSATVIYKSLSISSINFQLLFFPQVRSTRSALVKASNLDQPKAKKDSQ